MLYVGQTRSDSISTKTRARSAVARPRQKPKGEKTAVPTWARTLVVAAEEAGERPVSAMRALWNAMGCVRTRTRHERANLVGGLLGLGEWNAGY